MRIAVFLGSTGRAEFIEYIEGIGEDIAKAGHDLVCSDDDSIFSKHLINSVSKHGGRIILCPHTNTAQRTAIMKKLCDAALFIAGGFETMGDLYYLLQDSSRDFKKPIGVHTIGTVFNPIISQILLMQKMGLSPFVGYIHTHNFYEILAKFSELVDGIDVTDDMVLVE